MPNAIKVAAVQMNCVLGDVQANLALAEELIRDAARQGAKLVVVPELFDTGYRVEEKDSELASPIPGPTTDRMVALCKEFGIHIVGCIIERDGDQLYDTAFLTGPDGVVGTYRKTGLWATENDRFSKGTAQYANVYDIGGCKLGMLICYEIGFPEPARILTLNGADLIIYSSAFGKARLYAWDLASRSRALENGLFVIACNRSGVEKDETFFAGTTRIVNPKGDVLAQAAEDNEVIIAEIDLDEIAAQREAIPYLKDLKRNAIADYYRE